MNWVKPKKKYLTQDHNELEIQYNDIYGNDT